GGTRKTGMIEILSRVRKGTLDWETERVSPRPLRSQLKLYQPVENSVNENRTRNLDLQRKFASTWVIRITDTATHVSLHMISRGIAARNLFSYVIRSFQFAFPVHLQNRRSGRAHHGSLDLRTVRCLQKVPQIGRLAGKVGEIPSVQQREKVTLGDTDSTLSQSYFP
ncbi:MAG: hypothetical protein WCD77_00605, partial [Acidobacteriaceae bacterium]